MGRGVEVHFDVLPSAQRPPNRAYLFKILDLEPLRVHEYLDISDGTGDIVDSLHHKSISIIIDTAHPEPLQLGGEGDLCPFFVFGVLRYLPSVSSWRFTYLGCAFLRHVLAEDLLVLFAIDLVSRLDNCIVSQNPVEAEETY